MTDMAHWAAAYADRLRWAVFPIHGIGEDGRCRGCGGQQCAGKHPIPRHWERSIASATAALSVWKPELGQRGIGLVCGPRSGVWALDVDVRTGGQDTLAQLEQAHGELPQTWRARTGTGGQHIFFRAPDDTIRNSASQVMPGLDVRGAGGYVVLPPSPHRSGHAYEWVVAPHSVPLADAPGWLANLAAMRPRKRRTTRRKVIDELVVVPAGRRHDVLVRLAGLLRSCGFNEDVIVAAGLEFLRSQAAQEPPMDMAQAERDLRDVARRYPPTRPERNG